MARIFCLDDEINKYPRNAIKDIFSGHELTLATSRTEAGDMWQGPYHMVLFDHDLRGFYDPSTYINTGYTFLAALLQSRGYIAQLKEAMVLLHSQNFEGRANMSELLAKHNIAHESWSFGPIYLDRLRAIAKELPNL